MEDNLFVSLIGIVPDKSLFNVVDNLFINVKNVALIWCGISIFEYNIGLNFKWVPPVRVIKCNSVLVDCAEISCFSISIE